MKTFWDLYIYIDLLLTFILLIGCYVHAEDNEEINPCPKCHNKLPDIKYNYLIGTYVICMKCKTKGPIIPPKDESAFAAKQYSDFTKAKKWWNLN